MFSCWVGWVEQSAYMRAQAHGMIFIIKQCGILDTTLLSPCHPTWGSFGSLLVYIIVESALITIIERYNCSEKNNSLPRGRKKAGFYGYIRMTKKHLIENINSCAIPLCHD